jgi:hypothetical protein
LVFRAGVSLDAKVTVQDLFGRLLFQRQGGHAAAGQVLDWNPAAGTYLVRVEGPGIRHAELVRSPQLSF